MCSLGAAERSEEFPVNLVYNIIAIRKIPRIWFSQSRLTYGLLTVQTLYLSGMVFLATAMIGSYDIHLFLWRQSKTEPKVKAGWRERKQMRIQ